MKSEAEIYEAVARGWCHDANSAKEMDVLLGEAIAIEVLKVIRPLVAERDALAAENVQLREALEQWEWRDTLFDDGETHITYCPACSKLQRDGHEADCWMKAALSLHPSTASPSAPEGVSGDSEPKP